MTKTSSSWDSSFTINDIRLSGSGFGVSPWGVLPFEYVRKRFSGFNRFGGFNGGGAAHQIRSASNIALLRGTQPPLPPPFQRKEGGSDTHKAPSHILYPLPLEGGRPKGGGWPHRTIKRTIRNNRYRVSSFQAKPRNPFRLRSNNLCEYSRKRETCYPQLKSAPSGQLSQRGRLRYARSAIQNFAALLIFMRRTTTPNPTT